MPPAALLPSSMALTSLPQSALQPLSMALTSLHPFLNFPATFVHIAFARKTKCFSLPLWPGGVGATKSSFYRDITLFFQVQYSLSPVALLRRIILFSSRFIFFNKQKNLSLSISPLNLMCATLSPLLVLTFSLSLHRHPNLCIPL